MPDTVASVLIIVIAVFPGLIGDRIYRSLVGVDWREKEWQGILRLIGFSVVGLTIYALIAEGLDWSPPLHILPTVYTNLSPDNMKFSQIFLPYGGHLVGGSFAGLLGAAGAKILAKFSYRSVYPSAWDEFIRSHVPNHWVVLGFESGEVYAGKLKVADVSSSSDERDLVLEEPALYDPEAGTYTSTSYQYLFIKAKTVYSIAAVHEPTDNRIVPIGQVIFQGGKDES